MLFAYDDYESQYGSLKFIDFQRLHFLMLEAIGKDKNALELYYALIRVASDYAVLRSRWSVADKDWKLVNDGYRTSAHDALIISLNVLARYLQIIGKGTEWREELGNPEKDSMNRKRIGDFGCYLVFVHGLSAR